MLSSERRSPPRAEGANFLLMRMRATESALAKFGGHPLEWGRYDCARLAAHVLKALGHPVSLASFGRYTTELGALRALKRRGYARLDHALDAMGLPRCAPAQALPGDLIGFETEREGWVALGVLVNVRQVLGFYGAPPIAQIVQPTKPSMAWAVL